MTSLPSVNSGPGGHVAAWVGVGGTGMGPGGTDEWLQVGLASFDRPDGRLYYELALPGKQPKFTELASGIKPGQAVRVAVMELPFEPNKWIVISPKGIAGPFYLPKSHGKWAPTMTAESWAHGGAFCNNYSYRFDGVQTARPARLAEPPALVDAAGSRLEGAPDFAVVLQRKQRLNLPGRSGEPPSAYYLQNAAHEARAARPKDCQCPALASPARRGRSS